MSGAPGSLRGDQRVVGVQHGRAEYAAFLALLLPRSAHHTSRSRRLLGADRRSWVSGFYQPLAALRSASGLVPAPVCEGAQTRRGQWPKCPDDPRRDGSGPDNLIVSEIAFCASRRAGRARALRARVGPLRRAPALRSDSSRARRHRAAGCAACSSRRQRRRLGDAAAQRELTRPGGRSRPSATATAERCRRELLRGRLGRAAAARAAAAPVRPRRAQRRPGQ